MKPNNFVSFDPKTLLNDPKVAKEYQKLQPEFAMIRAILDARINQGLTQTQLAQKMGTKQAVISRLENGTANPSLNFLKRLATALNATLEIHFKFQ